MKRLIIATVLLIAATALVTFVYFRHLANAGHHTNLVMRTIPNDASLIFEFNNEKEFYDIFSGNTLFANVLGREKQEELFALRKLLIQNPLLSQYFLNQNIFLSLHPQKGNTIDFLITASVSQDFKDDMLELLSKQPKNGMVITAIDIAGKPGYVIYLTEMKKRFYLINKDDHSLSGSFSKEVIENCAKYDYRREKELFVQLPDQQQSNSLANLYINYQATTPLIDQLFQNKNSDIFKTFRQYPIFSALSLNYKSDALIFNGTCQPTNNQFEGYLSLFVDQLPVVNHLKEIFPSTTAYCTTFSVSNPQKFESELAEMESKTDFNKQRASTLAKVKSETGTSLLKEFARLLGNEFAIVTTHYREKIAIIQVNDGTKLLALLTNASKMNTDNTGQLNYDKLPQILLGDAFSSFKRPYFKVIDNYLILANTMSEIISYNDTYTNRKFLIKTDGYNEFNNLLAERCNISFFMQFKNSLQLFKQDMRPTFLNDLNNAPAGWKNFYGLSWQLSSSEKNYYTNFCMRLNTDTTLLKNSP